MTVANPACTLRFEHTASTRSTFIGSTERWITMGGDALMCSLIRQSLTGRAHIFVPCRVVLPILNSKALLAPAAFLLLVEMRIFHISFDPNFIKVSVVLFASISRIGYHTARKTAQALLDQFQVGDQCIQVIGIL